MKLKINEPPRRFEVGHEEKFLMSDCAHIALEPDEQVTFLTPDGGEYDVARKDWGFYATPSLNGRLLRFGFRAVMVKNRIGQYFIFLVEGGKEEAFQEYLGAERLEIAAWLDSDEALKRIEEKR